MRERVLLDVVEAEPSVDAVSEDPCCTAEGETKRSRNELAVGTPHIPPGFVHLLDGIRERLEQLHRSLKRRREKPVHHLDLVVRDQRYLQLRSRIDKFVRPHQHPRQQLRMRQAERTRRLPRPLMPRTGLHPRPLTRVLYLGDDLSQCTHRRIRVLTNPKRRVGVALCDACAPDLQTFGGSLSADVATRPCVG